MAGSEGDAKAAVRAGEAADQSGDPENVANPASGEKLKDEGAVDQNKQGQTEQATVKDSDSGDVAKGDETDSELVALALERSKLNKEDAVDQNKQGQTEQVTVKDSVSGDVKKVDETDSELAALALGSLKVDTEGAKADNPEISRQAPQLNEDVESLTETEIKKVVADGNTIYSSAKSFEDLQLSPTLLQGIYSEMKFEKPSKIQAMTLPIIVRPPFQNLIAQAHNGSGKTTCFTLGMLSRVDPNVKAPQALCVCPTRELAIQNEGVLLKMGKYTGITSALAIPSESGSSLRGQVVDQVIIGTPGTIKKWMSFKMLSTKQIKILVFDEADHMLDQDGFRDDSDRIMKDIMKSRGACQILLFSATFSEKVKQFAVRTVPRASYIFVPKEDLSLDVIKQYRVKCPSEAAKIEVLRDRIFPVAERLGQSIIFVRTRQSASNLHRSLEADGHKCTSIQGGLSHEDRDRVIREFRSGETKILIATDVLARGFDQAQVTLVVNYDVPVKQPPSNEPDYEVYLHRIGRSGRFGRKGAAFNLLVSKYDEEDLDKIARHFNRVIPEVPYDDDDAIENVLREAGLA